MKNAPLDNGRINTILWLTDWRVALLLIGSTYILGLGLTFLTLIDEVLPPDIRSIKTILAIVFLFSGMTGACPARTPAYPRSRPPARLLIGGVTALALCVCVLQAWLRSARSWTRRASTSRRCAACWAC